MLGLQDGPDLGEVLTPSQSPLGRISCKKLGMNGEDLSRKSFHTTGHRSV
jgi:hypothetical protein